MVTEISSDRLAEADGVLLAAGPRRFRRRGGTPPNIETYVNIFIMLK